VSKPLAGLRFRQFVQTRFNVRIDLSHGVEDWRAWCDHRAEVFLDVTLPSMLGQSSQQFDWLVYFDTERFDSTERVLAALEPHSNVHPLFYDGRGKTSWDLMGRARLGVSVRASDAEVVVTTKLDSDDALNRTYVERVAEQVGRLEREEVGSGLALNFTLGALLVEGRFFAFEYPHSPYLALVEPVGEPVTAMTIQHHRVHTRFPVRQIAVAEPMWLQVVHDRNRFNSARRGLAEYPDPPAIARLFSR
jgi:hypothetical protein